MKTYCLFALALLLLPSSLWAQTTVLGPNPGVTFTASADHYSNALDGTPLLASYQFDAVAMNSFGAVAITVNLGKPAPDGSNTIVATVPQLLMISPNVVYTATVSAIPTRSDWTKGVSQPSGPFGWIASATLASPANVRVR